MSRDSWIYKTWMRATGGNPNETAWIGIDLGTPPEVQFEKSDESGTATFYYGGRASGKTWAQMQARLEDGDISLFSNDELLAMLKERMK